MRSCDLPGPLEESDWVFRVRQTSPEAPIFLGQRKKQSLVPQLFQWLLSEFWICNSIYTWVTANNAPVLNQQAPFQKHTAFTSGSRKVCLCYGPIFLVMGATKPMACRRTSTTMLMVPLSRADCVPTAVVAVAKQEPGCSSSSSSRHTVQHSHVLGEPGRRRALASQSESHGIRCQPPLSHCWGRETLLGPALVSTALLAARYKWPLYKKLTVTISEGQLSSSRGPCGSGSPLTEATTMSQCQLLSHHEGRGSNWGSPYWTNTGSVADSPSWSGVTVPKHHGPAMPSPRGKACGDGCCFHTKAPIWRCRCMFDWTSQISPFLLRHTETMS